METKKITSYLLYAVGEIILVVIGILIAIQIDDWNNQRLNEKEAESILRNISRDLEEDIIGFERAVGFLENRKSNVDSLLLYIADPWDSVDHAVMAKQLITSGYILDYTPVFPTYNEILGSGKLGLIQSDNLKSKLAIYKSFVENNERITSQYDEPLKKFESKAISLLSKTPKSQHFISDPYEANQGVEVDLEKLRNDKELLEALRHNSYHTQVEIIMKRLDYLQRIEELQQIINGTLKK